MPWSKVKVVGKKIFRSKPDIISYDTIKVELEMTYDIWKKLRLLIEAPDAYDREGKKIRIQKKFKKKCNNFQIKC